MKISRRETCDRYYITPKIFGYAVFLHRLHKNEKDGIFHNHPWSGVSLIFGSYLEQRLGESPKVKRFFNFVRGGTHHRIELPNGPVWTLFIHGPKFNRWEVVDKDKKVLDIEPWVDMGNPERKSYLAS
jgi:hypothetical protein